MENEKVEQTATPERSLEFIKTFWPFNVLQFNKFEVKNNLFIFNFKFFKLKKYIYIYIYVFA